ncbi:RNI-like protein [Rhizoclosmatium globosum]|uniref:RNI-like protein n=1 Tax=Rhizoclosmatium globosum TaxID=329046 RepID=A0A1Y2CIZ8_9FUNG|nr:RNI-like protein [Rhizoclosmatium globosum]|eukprot:ORY46887.1 RNI-like protein [Rhizoclosmatium globosum]
MADALEEATKNVKKGTPGTLKKKPPALPSKQGGKSKKGGPKDGLIAVADLLAADKDKDPTKPNTAATAKDAVVATNATIDEEDEPRLEQDPTELDDGWESDSTSTRLKRLKRSRSWIQKVKEGEREIVLAHRGLGPKGAEAVAAVLESNSTIVYLDLSDNWIESGGATIGRSLQINRTLTFLNLANNKLSLQGGTEMAEMLAFNGTLKTLILSGNRFGDKEASLLAEGLKQNSSLQAIDLSHNQIGDLGALALGAGLVANDSLKELNLAWNEIRVRGANGFLNFLKDNGSVSCLSLQDNGVGENGVAVSAYLAKSNAIQMLNLVEHD